MLWGIATPLRPPAGLTLDQLTRRSTPLTFAGRALTNGPLHLVVIGQPMGTLRNKVRAQPTTGSPPCRPDAAVSPLQAPATAPSVKGVTPEPRARCLHPPPHFHTCKRTQRKILWHCYPTKAPDHTRRHARNNLERGIFPHTSASQKMMKNDYTSYISCVCTV